MFYGNNMWFVAALVLLFKHSTASPSKGFIVSINTLTGSRCGTDDDVSVKLKGDRGETAWAKLNFPNHNDFEQGDWGNYEVLSSTVIEVRTVCLWKQCTMISDDWCPAAVNLFNRETMDFIGGVKDFGRMNGCKEVCRPLMLASPPAPAPPPQSLVLDVLFMADIGHSPESAGTLTAMYPMGKSVNEGAFSLYRGLYDFVANKGNKPSAVLVMGDVGYVGGNQAGNAEIATNLLKYLNNVVTADKVFVQIGNHDVNYIGCIFPTGQQTCYYGSATSFISGGSVSKESISYEEWVASWMRAYPGLGNVILPPRTSALAPTVQSWAAPLRYNIDLGTESSIYFIAGLVAGALQKKWGPHQPIGAYPAESQGEGATLECAFLEDSIAYGRSLGKTVFVYLTHDYLSLPCSGIVNQVDVWLYGHLHRTDQTVHGGETIVQEERSVPIRMLIGNGGFDEGEIDVVSFGNLKEYNQDGRVKIHFNVYDTCISNEGCPSSVVPNQHCWSKCHFFPNGNDGIIASPSKHGFGFIFDAPAKGQTATNRASAMAPEAVLPSLNTPWTGKPEKIVDELAADDEDVEWNDHQSLRLFPGTNITTGCILWNLKPAQAAEVVPNVKLGECQAACKNKYGCTVFSYKFSERMCNIHQTRGQVTYSQSSGTISGPPTCGEIADACTVVPDASFPAETEERSMAAWPTGFQPQVLQCWPRDRHAVLRRCPQYTVLQDVAKGWPGRCIHMHASKLSLEDCEFQCLDDPACPAWIFTKDGVCHHGVGSQCYGQSGEAPVAGQRIMHGEYRAIVNLTRQVLGLIQVFNAEAYEYMIKIGHDPVNVCRSICLSYTICQIWQLLDNGCFIEMKTSSVGLVHYPLTHQQLGRDEAIRVVAGEFIQRFCEAYFGIEPEMDENLIGLNAERKSSASATMCVGAWFYCNAQAFVFATIVAFFGFVVLVRVFRSRQEVAFERLSQSLEE